MDVDVDAAADLVLMASMILLLLLVLVLVSAPPLIRLSNKGKRECDGSRIFSSKEKNWKLIFFFLFKFEMKIHKIFSAFVGLCLRSQEVNPMKEFVGYLNPTV